MMRVSLFYRYNITNYCTRLKKKCFEVKSDSRLNKKLLEAIKDHDQD